MARKNENPQKATMRDIMSVLFEGVLDEELDEKLGYSKYDYRNKDTDNSRNGHSKDCISKIANFKISLRSTDRSGIIICIKV